MSLAQAGGVERPRRRTSSRASATSEGADISELTEEEDVEDEDEDENENEDGYWGDGGLRRRFRRARALVDALLNKLHNGSARAVDPAVARALQWHEARLMSLQCFVEQGSIDRRRELKGESAVPQAAPTLGATRKAST